MTSEIPARAGRREWIGLAVLALPTLLLSMDLTVLHLAVPSLSADLKPSSSQLLWITDIYGFLLAGFLITMGTLGDRIGRRKLLLIGAAAFGGASMLAAFAGSAELLIAARALLGVAGATLMPSTLALIRNMFHDSAQRSVAIGTWMISFMVGAAIGPLVGGALLENFWWGSVFLLGVPVMVLLLVVGPILLPEYRDPKAGRVDLISAGMSLVAVLTVIYAIKDIAEHGADWLAALLIVVGLVIGAGFVRRQRKLADPLLDLNLFASRAFSGSLAIMMIGSFIMMGLNLFIAQYLQMVLGLSPLSAGLWGLPMVGGLIVGVMLASTIVRWVRPSVAMGVGMVIAAAGFGMLTQVDATGGLAIVVTGSIVFAIGLAPGSVLSTDLVVSAAPPDRAGAASAISETSQEFGGALGLAVLGAIGTAVYRGDVADVVPAGVPPEATTAAQDTLGGAMATAGQLSGQLGVDLLAAARQAFTHGLQVTAGISAAVVAVSGILIMVLLRNLHMKPEPEDQPDSGQAAEAVPVDVVKSRDGE
ncbi:MFS transporter [Actinosynnema sp. ALI-1.44]|uniref:MFS transporter n=1 Tax=Actinosynnema sp. ALI-1.44 TaxID=1933779 RepID=UPI00097BF983|nr:MFS transporter [Actinosynnema sp. ALI-1.44]